MKRILFLFAFFCLLPTISFALVSNSPQLFLNVFIPNSTNETNVSAILLWNDTVINLTYLNNSVFGAVITIPQGTNYILVNSSSFKTLIPVTYINFEGTLLQSESATAQTYVSLIIFFFGVGLVYYAEKTKNFLYYVMAIGLFLINIFFSMNIPFSVSNGKIEGSAANMVLAGVNFMFMFISLIRAFPIVFEIFSRR